MSQSEQPPHHSNRIQFAREILKGVPSIQCLCWPLPSALFAHLHLTEYFVSAPLPESFLWEFLCHWWCILLRKVVVQFLFGMECSKTACGQGGGFEDSEKVRGMQSWALLSSVIFGRLGRHRRMSGLSGALSFLSPLDLVSSWSENWQLICCACAWNAAWAPICDGCCYWNNSHYCAFLTPERLSFGCQESSQRVPFPQRAQWKLEVCSH